MGPNCVYSIVVISVNNTVNYIQVNTILERNYYLHAVVQTQH